MKKLLMEKEKSGFGDIFTTNTSSESIYYCLLNSIWCSSYKK